MFLSFSFFFLLSFSDRESEEGDLFLSLFSSSLLLFLLSLLPRSFSSPPFARERFSFSSLSSLLLFFSSLFFFVSLSCLCLLSSGGGS
jgi:hypothetical protein